MALRQAHDLGMDSGVDQRRHAVRVDCATRPTPVLVRAARGRRQRHGQIGPMNQIVTDRMSPMNGAVERSVRVVLIEEVQTSLPLDQYVWLVHSILGGQEMESWAVSIGRRCVNVVYCRHPFLRLRA